MTRDRLREEVIGSGKNRFLPLKATRDRLKEEVIGSGKNRFLPLQSDSRQAERGSYREWQEPVLATLK